MPSRVHLRLWIALLLCVFGWLGCSEPAAPSPAPLRAEPRGVGAEHAPAELPAPRARDATFHRGVTLGPLVAPHSVDAFKRAQSKRLNQAVALGATDVQLVVRWTQTQHDAIELAPFDSIDDSLLQWLIDTARRRKLRVLLSPGVAVESAEGARPVASLAPTDWERWWWSYRRFVLHYARVAAARKVPLFSVGSGLTSTEGQADSWRALIAEVREIYPGRLTYLASGEGFARVGFWDAVDVAGVAVAQTEGASDDAQLASLASLHRRLAESAPTRERGYLISEAAPESEPLAPELVRTQQRALLQSFGNDARLLGVFMNDAGDPAPKRNPIAGEVMRHWYMKSKD